MNERKRQNGSSSVKKKRAMTDDFSIEANPTLARQHAGEWVAIKHGKAVAYSKDSGEVFRKLRTKNLKGAVIHFMEHQDFEEISPES